MVSDKILRKVIAKHSKLRKQSIRRCSSSNTVTSLSVSIPNITNNVDSIINSKNSEVPKAPSFTKAEYLSLREGLVPFSCTKCRKRLSKAALVAHVRTKHCGQANSLCNVCNEQFQLAGDLIKHVANDHQLFECSDCTLKFSEFGKLRQHLRSSHGTEWPWICGFCDTTLFYDREFQIHIKGHTEKGPYQCPECAESFDETEILRKHLADEHLPAEKMTGKQSCNGTSVSSGDDDEVSKVNHRDENAVSHEIASLLLNLASRTTASLANGSTTLHKAEDLSTNSSWKETAMDLSTPFKKNNSTKSAPPEASLSITLKNSSAAINMTSSPSTYFLSSSCSTASSSSPYNYLNSSFASSITPSCASQMAAMNQTYLLQNLLLGKMAQQQLAAASVTPSTSIANSSSISMTSLGLPVMSSQLPTPSFPTQPLPAQTLCLPVAPTPSSVKPTLKPSASGKHVSSVSTLMTPSYTSSLAPPMVVDINNTAANIPLLCGQIVSQLNGLLFLVHGLSNPSVELNLQTQLTAIYSRLQEVVTMVEAAKQHEDLKNTLTKGIGVVREAEVHLKTAEIQKQLDIFKETKLKEEEKIVKHIKEYQKALQLQADGEASATTEGSTSSSSINTSDATNSTGQVSDVSLSKLTDTETSFGQKSNRRRSRSIKGFGTLDTPLEKRPKINEIEQSCANKILNETSVASGVDLATSSSVATFSVSGCVTENSSSIVGGRNCKGIRNRVFCGECSGCLKNDDCGSCRYCQDKTKFGGQNRLRQKCLHRRCQMDTHRKRSSNHSNMAAIVSSSSFSEQIMSGSPSPTHTIYSGVDLARLATAVTKQQSLALSAVAAVLNTQSNGDGTSPTLPNSQTESRSPKDESLLTTLTGIEAKNGHDLVNDKDHLEFAGLGGTTDTNVLNGPLNDENDKKFVGNGGTNVVKLTQSRIDKWKVKHEAMLKLGANQNEEDIDDCEEDEEESSISVPSVSVKKDPLIVEGRQKAASLAKSKVRHNTSTAASIKHTVMSV